MAQRFKKAVLTAAALSGFASMSLAEEPLRMKPTEPVTIVSVSTEHRDDMEDKKKLAVLGCLIILGGLGAYALTRERSLFGEEMKGDRSEDDVWKD